MRIAVFICASAFYLWSSGLRADESRLWKDALVEPAMETQAALDSVMLGTAFAGDRMVAVGERGHILYSDDGNSWYQSAVPARTTLTSVFFASPQVGWAVGHDTLILKTSDGGETWVKQLDGIEANVLVLHSAEERLAKLQTRLENATDEERQRLAPALEFAEFALEEAERDMEIGPSKALMDIWFADENVGLAVGASGYVLRTVDGGENWIDWTEAIGSVDFFHFYKLFSNNDNMLFLVGEAGQAYRSDDVGATWITLDVPYAGSYFGGLSKQRDSSIYIFGMSGVVLRSDDNGDSWDTVPSSTRSILQNGSRLSDDRVVLVGLGGTLLVEDARAATFIPIDLGSRTALSAVLGGEGDTLLLAGEAGIRVLDVSKSTDKWASQADNSFRFMFNRRNGEQANSSSEGITP